MEMIILSKTLIAVFCAWMVVGCSLPASSSSKSSKKWEIGTPIVNYWTGPGTHMPLNDQTAAQLCAGGWNLGWAEKSEALDVFYRHGIRVMLIIGTPNIDDPAEAKALDELIEKVRYHPALYAYYIVDEPGAGAFPALGKLVKYLRERDPAHLAYINLLPTYATDEQLQVSDDTAERAKVGYPQNFLGVADDKTALRYREHLRQYVEVVQPDLISYDHYHFMKNSDGNQYFLNLALVRMAALEANKPFLNIIQTCDSPSEGWREPGENELRWLTYTSLAYGAQGISHFRYDIGLWKDPGNPATLKPLYWALARINRDFVAIATQLQPLKSLGAYHCGTLPIGAQALPAQSIFTPEPASQEILLGYFGKSADHPTHVLVVNLDYKKSVTTTLIGPGSMQIFHAPTQSWSEKSESSRLKLVLPPGGGVLIRLSK